MALSAYQVPGTLLDMFPLNVPQTVSLSLHQSYVSVPWPLLLAGTMASCHSFSSGSSLLHLVDCELVQQQSFRGILKLVVFQLSCTFFCIWPCRERWFWAFFHSYRHQPHFFWSSGFISTGLYEFIFNYFKATVWPKFRNVWCLPLHISKFEFSGYSLDFFFNLGVTWHLSNHLHIGHSNEEQEEKHTSDWLGGPQQWAPGLECLTVRMFIIPLLVILSYIN